MADDRARLEKLKARKAAIEAQSAKLREQRGELLRQKYLLNDQVDDLTRQINAIEQPALVDVTNEIGRLSVSLGGLTMKAH